MISITVNGQRHTLNSKDTTLATLILELGLGQQKIAIEYNRNIVPRSSYSAICLQEGDHLEIITAVGGG